MIEHGQQVCKLTFDRMLEPPDILYGPAMGSSYQHQEETLGKYFRRATRRGRAATAGPADGQQTFPIDPSR
jgi:hypothetical protein